jgi:hypothetical protein
MVANKISYPAFGLLLVFDPLNNEAGVGRSSSHLALPRNLFIAAKCSDSFKPVDAFQVIHSQF